MSAPVVHDVRAGCAAHYRTIFAMCVNITRDREAARDLAHDAIAAALRSAHTYQPGTGFLAWMKLIARREWWEQVDHRKKRRAISVEDDGVIDRRAVPPVAEQALMLRDALAAFDRLSDAYRAPLALVARGWEPDEIAGALGINATTARTRLFKGRAKLREMGV